MRNNTITSGNAAFGNSALRDNMIGNVNAAFGNGALILNTGNANIALGAGADSAHVIGDNNIHIGNDGDDEDGQIRIGTSGTHVTAFIQGIWNHPIAAAGSTEVRVTSSGELGFLLVARCSRADQDAGTKQMKRANYYREAP